MKATQDNAVWVSNTYEQGVAENNWALMDVSYRAPKSPFALTSSTTTSVKVLNTSTGLTNGDSLSLYNPTDGYVDYSASITSQEAASNTTTEGSLSRLGTTLTSDFFIGYLNTWNPDGTRFWTYEGGGSFKEYIAPRPFDFVGASSEGSTLVNSYALNFPERGYTNPYYYVPNDQKLGCSFSSDGYYFFTVTADTAGDMGRYLTTFTLSTPYNLATVTNVKNTQLLASGATLYTLFGTAFGTTNASYYFASQGFSNIKFSADGLKGFLVRRAFVQDPGQQYYLGSYTLISFTCSKPYDLSTATSIQSTYMNLGTSGTVNGTHISDDGKVIHVFWTNGNSTAYVWRIHFNSAFNASSYAGTYVTPYLSVSSAQYNANNNYSFHSSVTVDPTGYYKTITNFNWVLQKAGAEPTPHWNRTVLDTSAASLTAAPTKVGAVGKTISGLSYQDNTRSAVAKEKLPFAISKDSTPTTMFISPPLEYQNAGDFVTGDNIIVENVLLPAGTVTRTADYYTSNFNSNILGSYTTALIGTSKATQVKTHARQVGSKTFTYSTAVGVFQPYDWNARKGIAFNKDGTKFWMSGPNASSNFVFAGVTITQYQDAQILEFDVTTPWDLSTTVESKNYSSRDFFPPSPPTINYPGLDFQFSEDGTKFFILQAYSTSGQSYLYSFDLATPWDLSSKTYNSGLTLNSFYNYSYCFSFAPDGKFLTVGTATNGGGSLNSPSYTNVYYFTLSTAWDLSTAAYKSLGPNANMIPAACGDENNGYIFYSFNYSGVYGLSNCFVTGVSGNVINFNKSTSQSFDTIENYSAPTNAAPTKFLVTDGGTKFYAYFTSLHQVIQVNAPFGHFDDRYQVDISSLGLSTEPRDVRFGYKTTYESLGTPSVTTENDYYKELTYPSKPINTETLKFKIEGDTGAEVSRLNVDIYTS